MVKVAQQVAADQLFGGAPEPPVEQEAPKSDGWFDLPPAPEHPRYTNFPYSGSPLIVTPDGVQEVLVQWKVTREMRAGGWYPTAFFMLRNGGGQRITFEPLGYKRLVE